MNKVLNQGIILAIGLLFYSCDHTISSGRTGIALPEITSIGRNAFGMKVNDEVWIPSSSISMFNSLHGLSFYKSRTDSMLRISAIDHDNWTSGEVKSIYIDFVHINNSIEANRIIIYWKNPRTPERESKYLEIKGSEASRAFYDLNVKIKNKETIFSGQFNFNFTHPDFENEFVISDGRFDVKR